MIQGFQGGFQGFQGGGFQGQATDIDIHAREILRTRDKLNELLVKHTGQSIDRIKNDTERDYFMGAGEAKEYGVVDEILIKKKDAPDKAAHGK